jgi:DNA-binding response OmpR family regulator
MPVAELVKQGRKPVVLIIEDEHRVISFLQQALNEADYDVLAAETKASGEQLWTSKKPDLVILDLMLSDGDGLDLLAKVRAQSMSTPVLVLSAKSSMADRVSGLDAGADDYLPKPFGIEELLARLRVMLRRAREPHQSVFECGDLKMDLVSRRVTRSGRVVFLSETEYRMLELLAASNGEPVPKREMLRHVWDDPDRDDNVVEVYISYLRNKLEWGGASRLIHTVRGRGYVLAESHDPE